MGKFTRIPNEKPLAIEIMSQLAKRNSVSLRREWRLFDRDRANPDAFLKEYLLKKKCSTFKSFKYFFLKVLVLKLSKGLEIIPLFIFSKFGAFIFVSIRESKLLKKYLPNEQNLLKAKLLLFLSVLISLSLSNHNFPTFKIYIINLQIDKFL